LAVRWPLFSQAEAMAERVDAANDARAGFGSSGSALNETRTFAPPDARKDMASQSRVIEALARSEQRLRAAGELVGLAVYGWNPQTDTLEWDDGLRALWGIPPGEHVERSAFEAGIHPEDRLRVQKAIAACIDPAGDGRYALEYRVIGRDGVERWLATAGVTTFMLGRPVDFIGAAVDISERKRAEAAIRESEARFRSFAEHSTNLLWIINPAAGKIEYRSPAYEQIWGEPRAEAPTRLDDWLTCVHPDDLGRVRRALRSVENGDVAQVEYRITRPSDGELRWLRGTSFPICDSGGAVVRIGGIAEDLTRHDGKQVYIVGASSAEQRRLAALIRGLGLRARAFSETEAFLNIAPFLAPGCVLIDLRGLPGDAGTIALELRARSIPLKTIVIGPVDGEIATAVESMKSGAADYLQPPVTEGDLKAALAMITTESRGLPEEAAGDEAAARLARLSTREREVLNGLLEGGTNKAIALKLGISPRTVELHRGQIMSKLNASSLAELLQLAMTGGLRPGGLGLKQSGQGR
jgi:PAS domain S-box-containing protein